MLVKKLGSKLFFRMRHDFSNKFRDYDEMCKIMPLFLKDSKNLSLDQKFYFAALMLTFDTRKMEKILTGAGIFYPDKLRVVPMTFTINFITSASFI